MQQTYLTAYAIMQTQATICLLNTGQQRLFDGEYNTSDKQQEYDSVALTNDEHAISLHRQKRTNDFT